MIKGIIFDLDGTTLNTLYDIQDAINLTLKEFNYPSLSYDEVKARVGRGSRNLIKDAVPEKIDDEKINIILQRYIEIYGQHYAIKTIPYVGIRELLKELNKRNILISFNSNKPDEFTKNLIKLHYPEIDVLSIYGARDDIPYKPDPAAANIIVKEMKLNKDEVLYVGDSETDIKTAKNTNLKSVGCTWGFRDYETLLSVNADYIIQKPSELLDILEK